MAAADQAATLVTVGVSHYAEKARWALQRYGIPFVEEVHAPGPHRFACRATGGRGSVPCLRLPPGGAGSGGGGQQPGCVDESTPILRWADQQAAERAAASGQPPPPPLFPAGPAGEQVKQLVLRFDRRLGPAVRVWAYSHLLYTPAIAQAMVAPPVPPHERWLLRCGGWWLLRRMMVKGMGISPEGGDKALARIRACFDDAAELLADGRPFLAGSAFTAADLTFAALAAPAVGHAYGTAPGLDSNTPPAMAAQLAELRAHPAGRHALRMWAEQRGVVLGPAAGGSKL